MSLTPLRWLLARAALLAVIVAASSAPRSLALAQIYPGGAVNGASFVPVSQPDHAIAPGEIASLFGNFGEVTAVASLFPLPYTLGGVSVTVAGVPAPILYAAPGQINIEVPNSPPSSVFSCNGFAGDCYGQASVVVTVNGRVQSAANIDFMNTAPMLFTRTGTGCGPGAVLNVSANGSTSVNSPANSASPGDFIEVFGTGLGAVTPVPTDGLPSPSSPPSISTGLYFGPYYEFDGESATGSFAGRAPGLAGVDQYNIQIPNDVRQGCAVPLRVGASYNNAQSQPVTVSIHSGGGQCVDPPIWAYGKIVIKKSVVLNDSTAGETDTFTATFPAAPAQVLPTPIPESPGTAFGVTDAFSPSCPIPGYSTLNAGPIIVTNPAGVPAQITPTEANGETTYSATLPAGFVTPGVFQIVSAGGDSVGAFQVSVTAGPEIQVTSQYPQGSGLGPEPAYTVDWTGGQADQAVTERVIAQELLYNGIWINKVAATAGTAGIPTGGGPTPVPAAQTTEIRIQLGTDPEHITTFTAPGLILGGRVYVIYEYRFINIPG